MKIKTIRYQNFRNFADKGEVTFDTSGKVTIVYGTNGDGKTTLHQLFRWVLYEKVNFNRTTSEAKLYNLGKGEQLGLDRSFVVWGEVEFEHNGETYNARREYTYHKLANGNIIRKKDGDSFYVQKKCSSVDWRDVDYPETLIESVLPFGLSPYFFFDGETMIADLKIRGTDSAKQLKKALYTIFDLEAYEKALEDLGSTTRSQSVIGKIEDKRLKAAEDATPEEKIKRYLKEIKFLTRNIEEFEEENAKLEEEVSEMATRLTEISEQIGVNKSKKQLENSRQSLVQAKKQVENTIKQEKLKFGKEIEDNYAYLLISEVIKSADSRLYMQVQDEEKQIIPGLTKELLVSLLGLVGEGKCICGQCIDKRAAEELEKLKGFFPPASYKATYDRFRNAAAKYSRTYDKDALFEYLKRILQCRADIKSIEDSIEAIDEELKNAGNIDELIEERKKIEIDKAKAENTIKNNLKEIAEKSRQKRIREKKVSETETADGEVERYKKQIEFVERVVAYLKCEIQSKIKEYSETLQDCIQGLVDEMLTSKRVVALNEEFQLQVRDSYNDESKSEGQFAVVSFAYIGGILKVLQSHEKIRNKEYPLVLDGPFSKLDPEQKGNVIKTIPQYAPQVIIFSKDPLGEYISDDVVGKVYTIVSNDEKNNASIKEGYLWN